MTPSEFIAKVNAINEGEGPPIATLLKEHTWGFTFEYGTVTCAALVVHGGGVALWDDIGTDFNVESAKLIEAQTFNSLKHLIASLTP
jgi:hypothetical protein